MINKHKIIKKLSATMLMASLQFTSMGVIGTPYQSMDEINSEGAYRKSLWRSFQEDAGEEAISPEVESVDSISPLSRSPLSNHMEELSSQSSPNAEEFNSDCTIEETSTLPPRKKKPEGSGNEFTQSASKKNGLTSSTIENWVRRFDYDDEVQSESSEQLEKMHDRYGQEEKEDILSRLITGESIISIAVDSGIQIGVLDQWKEELKENIRSYLYTIEQIREMIKYGTKRGLTISQMAKEYGVSSSTIIAWKRMVEGYRR